MSDAVRRHPCWDRRSRSAHRFVPVPRPTGVGKTELAKAPGRVLFDDERADDPHRHERVLEKHSVARLVGPARLRPDTRRAGQLTEAVRRRPYSLVLLDEVEKAHPRGLRHPVAGDDGRLTDGQGRTVDFRNTILVLTSNMGSQFLIQSDQTARAAAGAGHGCRAAVVQARVLNRLDDVVMFQPLQPADLSRSWICRSRRSTSARTVVGSA